MQVNCRNYFAIAHLPSPPGHTRLYSFVLVYTGLHWFTLVYTGFDIPI